MRLRSSLLCLAALVVLALPASGAQITQISYDVTGGTFNVGLSTGPITGGTLVYTPPGGSVSTPTLVNGGSLSLSLTGPSGFFSVLLVSPWTLPLVANIAPGSVDFYGFAQFLGPGPPGQSLGTPHYTVNFNIGGNPIVAGVGSLFAVGINYAGSFNHSFTVGNEVVTLVPEPGTAALMGLGVVVLGLAGAGRRAVSRVRRGTRRWPTFRARRRPGR